MKHFSKKLIRSVICFFMSVLWCQFSLAVPAEVIIIRHAEKPPMGGDGLTAQGQQRANALVNYFLNTPALTQYGTPIAIYAEAPRKKDTTRAILTCTPTANALNMTVQSTYTRDQYAQLAQGILSNPQYTGKTVLICWEHKTIPMLVNALGVQPMPSPWPDNVFDRTLVINYQANGSIASFQNLPQHLLDGDSVQ